MRPARLSLIVSSAALLLSLGTTGRPGRPADAWEPEPLRVIGHGDGECAWVRFDRPMVEPEDLGTPAPLEVSLPGRAVWSTVSTALFRPEGELPPSRSVDVTIRDVAALDGTRLARPFSWTFRTRGLDVLDRLPSTVGRRPRFELKFNRPVNPAHLADRAWFASNRAVVEARVTGSTVEPAKELPFDSSWSLVLDSVRSRDAAELERWAHSFCVCPRPRLLAAEGESSVSGPNEIRLKFANPVDEKDLRAKISVRPEAEYSVACANDKVILAGGFAAGVTYWVRIAPGARDTFGNAMDAVTATVAIPAYVPTLGLLERGTTLEPRGPLAVPLYCVNVPEARVCVTRLPGAPWCFAGDVVTDVLLAANAEPNEMFTHGVALPGPGHYRVEASAPDLGLEAVRYYQVTDLALTIKLGRDRSLACVTSYETAEPRAAAFVELCDPEGRTVWSGETDAEGRAWLPGVHALDAKVKYVIARTGSDLAWMDVDRSELPAWRLPVPWEGPRAAEPLRVFLYTERPIYRPGETVRVKGWSPDTAAKTIRLELRDWRRDLLESAVCRLSPAGGFDASFGLHNKVGAGAYHVEAVVGPRTATHEFQVGYLRPPTFEVSVRPARPHFLAGETFRAAVEARTYFGAPLSGALVQWSAFVEDGGEPAQGRAVLDREGRSTVEFVLGPKAGFLTVRAIVTDAAHQAIHGEARLPVHPAEVVIEGASTPPLGEAGKSLEIAYAVRRLDGTPADRDVSARLFRRTWSYVQQLTAGHGWSYVSEKHDELVASGFASGGRWRVTPARPGPHVIELRTVDDADRDVLTTVELDVVGPGEAAWMPRNDLLVELVPDRPLYRRGDVARVLVRNAPAGARALVTLEREGVSEARWADLSGEASVIEVPVLGDHAPNVHLGVLLFRGRVPGVPGPDGDDRGRPAFRHGYATLHVDTSADRIPVTVTTADEARPGGTARVEISAAPRAEIALAVVDQSVLSLAERTDPDPHEFFHAPRPLRVTTAEARPDLAARRPLDVRGKKGRPGGDGGPGREGRPSLRKDFAGTAYWNPKIEADASGRATVSFKLPDNLTRWRVVAVAALPGRWGTGAATFETRKPLAIVSALPRFACLGDAFEARWVVYNRSGVAGRVRVEMEGESREVDVADGASAPVAFPVRAEVLGPRQFRAFATLGALEDRLEITLPVRYPAATETILRSGKLRRGGELSLPPMANVDSVELVLGRSPLVPLEGRLRQLLDYPNGCVEQTTSKTIPLLACRDLGLEKTDEKIEAGVRRLLSMQTSSGGLAYWPGRSDPHPAGTVYATHALLLAGREGFRVPAPALHAALKYVEGMLREGVDSWRSYALYVLALAGRRHESYLHTLERDPFLALAAVEMGRPDLAREILSKMGPRPSAGLFDSALREACVTAIVRARLGESPGVPAQELSARATRTYEQAWCLLAYREMASAGEESGRAVKVFADDRPLSEWSLERPVRLSLRQGRVRLESDGSFWYAAVVRGQSVERAVEDHGFWVRRTYTRAGEDRPRRNFDCGDLVVVRVTVSAPRGRDYVALEDPLPAGFEPVDLAFRGEEPSGQRGEEFSYVERRDDGVFASVDRMAGSAYELVYLVRATTAGTFTAPAPRAEEMYGPDVWGRGPAATVRVSPR